MNIGNQHPEYAQMVFGMKSGHLPASKEDIASVEDRFVPQNDANQLEHPEYVDYCNYAKSLGYRGQSCLENKDERNIPLINLSLGGPSSKDNDPTDLAVKAACEAGTLVVVAG